MDGTVVETVHYRNKNNVFRGDNGRDEISMPITNMHMGMNEVNKQMQKLDRLGWDDWGCV